MFAKRINCGPLSLDEPLPCSLVPISLSPICAPDRGSEGASALGRVVHRHRLRSGGLPNKTPLGEISRARTPVDLALPTARLGAGWGGSRRGSRMSKPTRMELALVALTLLVALRNWS